MGFWRRSQLSKVQAHGEHSPLSPEFSGNGAPLGASKNLLVRHRSENLSQQFKQFAEEGDFQTEGEEPIAVGQAACEGINKSKGFGFRAPLNWGRVGLSRNGIPPVEDSTEQCSSGTGAGSTADQSERIFTRSMTLGSGEVPLLRRSPTVSGDILSPYLKRSSSATKAERPGLPPLCRQLTMPRGEEDIPQLSRSSTLSHLDKLTPFARSRSFRKVDSVAADRRSPSSAVSSLGRQDDGGNNLTISGDVIPVTHKVMSVAAHGDVGRPNVSSAGPGLDMGNWFPPVGQPTHQNLAHTPGMKRLSRTSTVPVNWSDIETALRSTDEGAAYDAASMVEASSSSNPLPLNHYPSDIRSHSCAKTPGSSLVPPTDLANCPLPPALLKKQHLVEAMPESPSHVSQFPTSPSDSPSPSPFPSPPSCGTEIHARPIPPDSAVKSPSLASPASPSPSRSPSHSPKPPAHVSLTPPLQQPSSLRSPSTPCSPEMRSSQPPAQDPSPFYSYVTPPHTPPRSPRELGAPEDKNEAEAGRKAGQPRTLEEIGLALFGNSFVSGNRAPSGGQGPGMGLRSGLRRHGSLESATPSRPSFATEEANQRQPTEHLNNVSHDDEFTRSATMGAPPPDVTPNWFSLNPRNWSRSRRAKSGRSTPLNLEGQDPAEHGHGFGVRLDGPLSRGESLPAQFDINELLEEARRPATPDMAEENDMMTRSKTMGGVGSKDWMGRKARHGDSMDGASTVDEGSDGSDSGLPKQGMGGRGSRKMTSLPDLPSFGSPIESRGTGGGVPLISAQRTPLGASIATTTPRGGIPTPKRGEGKPPRPGGKSGNDGSGSGSPEITQKEKEKPPEKPAVKHARSMSSGGGLLQPVKNTGGGGGGQPSKGIIRGNSLPKDMKMVKFDSLQMKAKHTQFQLAELKIATDNFSEDHVLGQGGFGKVYRGVLPVGEKEVAVKVLKKGSTQGDEEFVTELELLSRLSHRHLVKLLGFCSSGRQRLLVYQFVPNGSLYDHLHGNKMLQNGPLEWERRLKIAAGAAKGLKYLHGQRPQILHRDIKASNILITNSFEAKVADFGCARLIGGTKVSTEGGEERLVEFVNVGMGTVGHMAPEVLMSGEISAASDAFSYGVVLLELLTGKEPLDRKQPRTSQSLVSWALPLIQEGRWDELVDPFLINTKGVQTGGPLCNLALLAEGCLQFDPSLRPSFELIAQTLSAITQEREESMPELPHTFQRRGSPGHSPPSIRSDTLLFSDSETSGSGRSEISISTPDATSQTDLNGTGTDGLASMDLPKTPADYAKAMQAMISLIEEGQDQLDWTGGLKRYKGSEGALGGQQSS